MTNSITPQDLICLEASRANCRRIIYPQRLELHLLNLVAHESLENQIHRINHLPLGSQSQE